MPQPTMPTVVRIEQYCPFSQRLLMPMASPCSKWRVRRTVRGSSSAMVRSSFKLDTFNRLLLRRACCQRACRMAPWQRAPRAGSEVIMKKLSIGSWAFLFNQEQPTNDFHSLVHKLHHLGYQGVELGGFKPHPSPESHDTKE